MSMITAIGLMSGTSMDGIDVALVKSDGEIRVEPGPSSFFPYDYKTQNLIKKALDDAKSVSSRDERLGAMKEAEDVITSLHIKAVELFLSEHNLEADKIDVIGFHGQTVLHRPDSGVTIQLGDGNKLSRKLGIDVVYDMRANDMVHGGQGAPLIPAYHAAIAENLNEHKPIVFVNIGGISNITYVGEELLAFDTGPGNSLIDQWVELRAGVAYDEGGRIAASGQVNDQLKDQYLSNAYFDKPLPKSLDRNDFVLPQREQCSTEDGARTLAYVSAAAIMRSIDHFSETPDVWIVSGGGRHNPHIMNDLNMLAENMKSRVLTSEDVGFNGDAMEAQAWGYLAIRSKKKLPLSFPGTTGCNQPVSGGVIVEAR